MRILLGFSVILILGCNQQPDTLFQRQTPGKTGIDFKNTLRETEAFNVMKYTYFYNGGGVAIGDVNNDRLPDVYLTGNLVASHLYLNEGNWKFTNIAEDAGVSAAGLWNTGVTMADVNQDGWLDIYVCRSAAADANARRNQLFINQGEQPDGKIRFEEAANRYGLDDPAYSTQASFFDYDQDGDLDMFLLNHSLPEYSNFNSQLGQLKEKDNPNYGDKLYRNDGDRFTDVTEIAGIISNVLGFGLGVAVSDLNGDSWPDIYVSNDFNEEDYLYINQQDGTFKECLADCVDHASLFSMGSDAADINNDGATDLITLDMLPQDNYRIKLTSGSDNFNKYQLLLNQGFYKQSMRNMLHLNDANGRFREVGQLSGISNSDWSWSALFADYDLDGLQDLFVSNGYLRDYTNMDFLSYAVDLKVAQDQDPGALDIEAVLREMPKIEVPNKAYKNLDGLRFDDRSALWGFTEIELSNGAAFGDLDNDGDLDLVVNNVNDFAGVYRNTARERSMGHFLKVSVNDGGGRYSGIGTRVVVYADSIQMQRELFLSRGYQSSVEPILHFGLGDIQQIDSLVAIWPDGTHERFDVVEVDKLLLLQKGTGSLRKSWHPAESITLFDTVSWNAFTHIEDNFNDFSRQTLLPTYYSRQGPALASGDIDGDGRIDLVAAGAKGQATTVITSALSTPFHLSQPALEADAGYEDAALILSDFSGDGKPDLVVASGGNYLSKEGSYPLRYYRNEGQGQFVRDMDFPEVSVHASSLVAADFDQDGDVDLFVGGLYQSQNYPLPEPNQILWNEGAGSFRQDGEMPFAGFRTAAAVAADFDGDGHPDLAMAGEWEPVSVWSYVNGRWTLKAKSGPQGWFSSLYAANLDQDPASELVAGNWGYNSQLQASKEYPICLYYGDFDQNQTIDPIMSYHVDGKAYPFVSRDDLLGQLPGLKKQFTSYHDYAEYTMADLLPSLPDASVDSITSLTTAIYDLEGSSLTEIPLPLEAQVAPVHAITALDVNNDGQEDLILTGNNHFNRVKIGEMDANHGVFLVNQGQLQFQAVPNRTSGLHLRGDIRSVLPITENGRKYLIFGINNQTVRTYVLTAENPL